MKLKFIKIVFVSALLSLSANVSAEVVNINDASAAALSHYLKGVGSVKAESIVSYREVNGDFEKIEDIVNVKGIGPGILKKNIDDLSLTEGVVKWIKAKPKLVKIDSTSSAKTKRKKIESKKIASKTKTESKKSKDIVKSKISSESYSKKKDILK